MELVCSGGVFFWPKFWKCLELHLPELCWSWDWSMCTGIFRSKKPEPDKTRTVAINETFNNVSAFFYRK